MRRRGPWAVGLALVGLAFATTVGCEQILGIHGLDAGPLQQESDGSDVDGSSRVSSDGSSGGSSSDMAMSGSGSSSSGGPGSAIMCTSPSNCSSGQICCGAATPSLMSMCQPRASGCPVGDFQLCDTTTDCVTLGTTCQSYMNVVKLCAGDAGGGPASLGFTPSNFNPMTVVSGGVDWSQAPPVMDDLPAATVTIAMNDANATQADLYVLKSWAVTATKPITISGPRPAIVLVLTTVDIQGTIWVTAGGFQPGAAPGPGGGQSGGGGGSYCGIGGAGGSMVAPFPMGGSTYGNATLSPLLGGSAGASANCGGYSAGGGAIQIVAGASIAVRQYASINAGGSGGACSSAGGSGGAILLEAPTIQIAGNVAANGGAGATANSDGANATANGNPALGGNAGNDGGLSVGGNGSSRANINGGNGLYGSDGNSGGGGGTGRIRINTKTGSATVSGGIVSPALGGQDGGAGSAAGCATQGTISP